jgi:putative ABC transport system permease protein
MWPDRLCQDLRFGFRMLRRSPAFSTLAILCLTLRIGTTAAVFSWIEGILFHPYPAVAHEERMFVLAGTTRGASGFNQLSYPDCLDFQKNSALIESFIVDQLIATTLSIGDRAERAIGGLVTPNYFEALGVRPLLGRGFTPEEGAVRNAHPVAVTYTQRLAVVLLAIFGGTAVLLAAIGLYAVVSYAVSQNTRELSLRMALGARISDLLRLVLSRGVALTAGGLIIGAIAALALTRLLGNRLYKVSTYDPVAFGSAFLLMSVVALLACLLPARRATRIDPARVLRA